MPRRPSPEHTVRVNAIKGQARRQLKLNDDDIVMVRQLDCTEPGCPPVETVVAVLPPEGPARRWTLHHPISDITPDRLATALAEAPTTS
jgi:hypothetical protein